MLTTSQGSDAESLLDSERMLKERVFEMDVEKLAEHLSDEELVALICDARDPVDYPAENNSVVREQVSRQNRAYATNTGYG